MQTTKKHAATAAVYPGTPPQGLDVSASIALQASHTLEVFTVLRQPATLTVSQLVGVAWLVTVIVLLTACTPPGPRAVLEGKDLLDRGEYKQAIEEFRLATQLMPTNALAFNYLGLAFHQAGQPAEAERAYVRALSLNHDLTEVHYNLGCLWLLQSNRIEQARSELTTYTLRMPNAPEGWVKLGEIQLRARDVASAEKSLGEALRLDPHNAEALNTLGLARLNRRRPSEAAQLFAKASKEQPDYGPALLNLAVVAQQELNDPQLALQKYREYLALKPAPEDALAIKTVLNKLEQELAAAAAPHPMATNAIAQLPLHTNVSKAPGPDQAGSNLPPKPLPTNASQLAANSRPEPQPAVPKSSAPPTTNQARPAPATNSSPAPLSHVEMVRLGAEPVIKPADDVAPPAAPAGAEPAQFAPASGESAAHSTDAKPGKRGFFQKINPINLFTHDGKSSGTTGPAYAVVNDTPGAPPPRAIEPAEDPVNPAPAPRNFPRYKYRSPEKPLAGDRIAAERAFSEGVSLHQARSLSDAIQSYKRATQLDPAFYDAQYNLALAAGENGNLPLALSSYETALAIQPESLDARYNFGLTLKQAGYVSDAISQFERILSKYPTDGRTHLALGNLYAQQLKDPANARPHYLAVLAVAPQSPQAGAIRYWLSDHPK